MLYTNELRHFGVIYAMKCCFWCVEIEDTGATGRLTFREDGTRQGYIIDILGLAFTQLTKVGGTTLSPVIQEAGVGLLSEIHVEIHGN